MYCLWLNGKKVYTLQQLRASFDVEAVGLYCLGGGLTRWLKDCGERDAAEKVEHIDFSKNLSRQLAEIFGVDLPEKEVQAYEPAPITKAPVFTAGGSFGISPSSLPETSFFTSSFGSSFNTSSFNFSNIYTSFFITSFLTSSYEYEYESGSFTNSSFSLYRSSFSAETAFLSGSFTFASTSFSLFSSSFASEYGSFILEYGSFTPGSFRLTLSSFSPESVETAPSAAPTSAPEKELISLTPQQKFELNISSCPLNRYGYGIHLI